MNAPQAAGTSFDTSDVTVTGIYPYFYGTSLTEPTVASVQSAISGGTSTKVLSAASGNLTIPYNGNSVFYWFAHLASYSDKTQWYISADNKGTMGSSSLFDTAVQATVNGVTADGYWTNQTFDIYLGNYATTIASVQVGTGLF